MAVEHARNKRRSYWYEFLPWIFMCAALTATYLVWNGQRTAEFDAKNNEFNRQLDETAIQLTNQLKLFEQSLEAVRRLFDYSDFVSESEFNAIAAEVIHSKFSSGLQGIGFAKLVNPAYPETYANVEKKIQSEILQRYAPLSALHAPVIYMVKHETGPQSRLWFDAFENPIFKKEMTFVAKNNQILISDEATIGQENKMACHCLSMILPIYRYGKKPDNVIINQASTDMNGWVFLNIELNTFFEVTLGRQHNPEIMYSLYKHGQQDRLEILYQGEQKNAGLKHPSYAFVEDKAIELNGQKWQLSAHSLPVFEQQLNYKHSTLIGLLGLLVSAALTGVLLLLIGRLRTNDSLKQVNKQLKLSDERWRFAIEGSGDGVWDWNMRQGQLSFSKRWSQMFGYDEDELGDDPVIWKRVVHPDDYETVTKTFKQTLARGQEDVSASIECRIKCKDDTWKWVLARGMVVKRDQLGRPLRMVGTHTDISQLKESEEMIWQHANFDLLTGLPNRRMLNARLEGELEKARRTKSKLAVIFLDLDNFKEVNDTLGHDHGDALLKDAADRIKNCVYKQDIVSRFGGDEFAVLITDLDESKLPYLDIVAQKVLATLATPFELANEKVFISASIGVSIYPEDAGTITELVKSVDQAMYASKNRGGNCFTYFTASMQEQAVNRLRLSSDLRSAISRNELYIEYQPIVELTKGHIYKAEALLRWQHPERGFISPVEFIPIAESTRLINEIGTWVLKESMKQCAEWRQTINNEFQISVNKSPVQFADNEPENAQCLQAISDDPKLKSAIVIEITEGLILDDTGQVKAKLKAYQDNGVQIALDDFGTGYSSLSYLRKFDIDYLKIDRAFVANIETVAEDRILCRTIIAMAHSLGIRVIAEGVETEEQRDILLEAGCDFGQGYYFSKSLLPAQFEAYVEQV